ncbi:MAG: GNAT family N-acetyltransferase [Myxococcota bacterium]
MNNLPLGLADALGKGRTFGDVPPRFWTVEDEGEVVGAALVTPPYNLSVSMMGPPAVTTLAENIRAERVSLPGITGPAAVAYGMADALGQSYRVAVSSSILRLEAVRWPELAPLGQPRVADPDDLGLVTDWYEAFAFEVSSDPPHATPALRRHRAALAAQYGLERRAVHLWRVDDEPVCLASKSRELPRGGTVGPVYTPPEHRKRGYASALTAAVSQAILDSGKDYACLFTNDANRTSNKIYREIGYVWMGDTVQLSFNRP